MIRLNDERTKNECCVDTLYDGDFFMYKGGLFVMTDDHNNEALCLSNLNFECFENGTEVTLVDVEITIKNFSRR